MIEDNVLLDSEDKYLAFEHLYSVEGYSTMCIYVKSGGFSGWTHFCISNENVNSIINLLSIMNKDLKGCCHISDSDSDSCIILEMEKYGHVLISGQIGGSHEAHIMKFKFATDQTILTGLIQMLKKVLV